MCRHMLRPAAFIALPRMCSVDDAVAQVSKQDISKVGGVDWGEGGGEGGRGLTITTLMWNRVLCLEDF